MTAMCGPCAAGQCTGPGRGGVCEHACHQPRPVAARVLDRLHGEALAEEGGDTDCVDGAGHVYPEHYYGETECRRCGAEAPDAE